MSTWGDTWDYWVATTAQAADYYGDAIGEVLGYDASDWSGETQYTDIDAAYAYALSLTQLVGAERGWDPGLIGEAVVEVVDRYVAQMFASDPSGFYADLALYFQAGAPPPFLTPDGWTDLGHLQSSSFGWIEVALP